MEELGNLLKPLIEAYAGSFGPAVQLLAFIASTRLALKPLQLLEKPLFELIKLTPTKSDDKLLEDVSSSKAWKTVKFFVDYLLSIKLK